MVSSVRGEAKPLFSCCCCCCWGIELPLTLGAGLSGTTTASGEGWVLRISGKLCKLATALKGGVAPSEGVGDRREGSEAA